MAISSSVSYPFISLSAEGGRERERGQSRERDRREERQRERERKRGRERENLCFSVHFSLVAQ
jgi:hypothetical protein